MKNAQNATIGSRVKDSEGNEFIIKEIEQNDRRWAATLKNESGEKEICLLDLKYFTLLTWGPVGYESN